MKNCPTKVVIRRLPPKLTDAEFRQIVDPLPPHTYFRFCSPDPTLGNLGTARAYITFCDIDALFDFKERFDDYVFVDSEGNESYGLVEFAICQTLATTKETSTGKRSEKFDKKQGTLNEDPDFQDFLKTIQPPENATEASENEPKKTPWEAILEDIQARESALDKNLVSTPLLAYLNQRELENKRRDEDSMRHRKPFKQHPGSARKSSRCIDQGPPPTPPPSSTRPPPTGSRRSTEARRASASVQSARDPEYHGGGGSRIDEELVGSQKTGKDGKHPGKPVIDVEEFPAMQGSQQSLSKFPLGSWSDRSPAWTGSQPTLERGDTKLKSSSKDTKPSHVGADLESANREAAQSSVRSVSTTSIDRSVSESDSMTFVESNTTSDFSPHLRDSGGRGRRSTYYAARSQSGFTSHPRKPGGKPSRGRRDSESSSCVPGQRTASPDLDTPAEYDRGGGQSSRGRRGGGSRSNNSAADFDPYSGYTRGSGYRGTHQTFRNTGSSRSSEYNECPYGPGTHSEHGSSHPRRSGSSNPSTTPRGRGGGSRWQSGHLHKSSGWTHN
ncbi:Regulator of nonsense transcripts 3B [Clonorchis sinensis]|uniref:Regulator of nonsense transcripts 3B n=1 Tax=Clonorchis sinensis TaxID=79923 RepID=A0A8T1M7L5_CLOSI|nr:Regulator of nonsense transcripts 3B [Clonorchis sinensis]